MDIHPATSAGGSPPYEDALSLLGADHQAVSELFEQYQSALENESDEQTEIAEQIFRELDIHTQLEEELFYPAIGGEVALKALVDEALGEHAEVTATMQKLRSLGVQAPEFGTLMMQMMEDVEHHIDEEENVLFPEVERHFDVELTELAARLRERKRELLLSYGRE